MIKFIGRRSDSNGNDIILISDQDIKYWILPICVFTESIYNVLKEQGYTISSYDPWEMKDATGKTLREIVPVDETLEYSEDDIEMAIAMSEDAMTEYELRKEYVITNTSVIEFAEGDYKIKSKAEFIENISSLNNSDIPITVPMNYLVAPEARLSFEDILASDDLKEAWCKIISRMSFNDYNSLVTLRKFLQDNAGYSNPDKLNEEEFLKAYLHWGFPGLNDKCVSVNYVKGNWGSMLSKPRTGEATYINDIGLVEGKSTLKYGLDEIDLLEVGADEDDLPINVDETENKLSDVLRERRDSNHKYTKAWIKKKFVYDMVDMMFVTENGYRYNIIMSIDKVIVMQAGNPIQIVDMPIFNMSSVDRSHMFGLREVWDRDDYAINSFICSKADQVIKSCAKQTPHDSTVSMLMDLGYTYRQAIDYFDRSCSSTSGSLLYNPMQDLSDAYSDAAVDIFTRGKIDPVILSYSGYLAPEDFENYSSEIKRYYDSVFGSASLSLDLSTPFDFIPDLPEDYYDTVNPTIEEYLDYMDCVFDSNATLEKNMTKMCNIGSIIAFDIFLKSLRNLSMIGSGAKTGNWAKGVKEDSERGTRILFRIYRALLFAEYANPTLDDAIEFFRNYKDIENYIDLSEEHSIKTAGFDGYVLDRANASYHLYHDSKWNLFISKVFRELCNDPDKIARHYAVEAYALGGNDKKFKELICNTMIDCIQYVDIKPEHKDISLLYADELALKCVDLAIRNKDKVKEINYIPMNIGDDTYQIPIDTASWEVFASMPSNEPKLLTLNYLYSWGSDDGVIYFNAINCQCNPFRIIPMIYEIPEYSLGAQMNNVDWINNTGVYNCRPEWHLSHNISSATMDGRWLFSKQSWSNGMEEFLNKDTSGNPIPATYDDMEFLVEEGCSVVNGIPRVDNIFNYYTRFALQGKKCKELNDGKMISRVVAPADVYYGNMGEAFGEEILKEDEFFNPVPMVKWINFFADCEVRGVSSNASRLKNNSLGLRTKTRYLLMSNYDITNANHKDAIKRVFSGNLGDAYILQFGQLLYVYSSLEDVYNSKPKSIVNITSCTNAELETLAVNNYMFSVADGVYAYRTINGIECLEFEIGE